MASKKIKPAEESLQQQRNEILQVADAVAREKSIERDEVLAAMEQAIQKAAKIKYGLENDIRVTIDRSTGHTLIERIITVVDEVENEATEINLQDAQVKDPSLQVGDEISEELPPVEYGRVAAQSARQIIVQKVRDAERTRQYEEFKERVGEITTGVVKRIEFGNVILDIGRAECILRKEDIIPREVFRAGDRIRVLITELRPDAKGPMISVSRTHPHFMAKLFEQEVPEIYEGVIEIRSVARDPGSRAKMAVYTDDASLDPVGACVGMRGSRVQAVVNELQGEKVDIMPWSENPATFVVNALAPAEVIRVVIDEEAQRIDVVVAEDQLSLAIGRRGQNVRLATQLTGWNIDIITEEDDMARRNEENSRRVKTFMEALDVDDMVAQLLSAEGFQSVEDVAYVDIEEFANIEGFDEDIASELQKRAQNYLENFRIQIQKMCEENAMDPYILSIEEFSIDAFEKLLKANIKTRDDLAELSGEELLEIVGQEGYTEEGANKIIMAARQHWFE
jgi:N utilization substance protein A